MQRTQAPLEELDRDEETRQATWHQTLAAANLPALSPAALRDWQALLPAARTACEALQSRLDEFEQVQATEQALAIQLRAAIVATGRAMPAGDARLSTLAATAAEVDAEIKQRETAINQAAGKRLERERQLQQRAAREDELTNALCIAKDALKPAFAGLLLSEDTMVAVARARSRIRVEEMSEGTLDQLYLALRLAALDHRRAAGVDLPVILDDVLMTSDEDRSGAILEALADFAGENQVLVFTHHRHMVELAQRHVPAENLALIAL